MIQQQTPFLVTIDIILFLLLFYLTKPSLKRLGITTKKKFIVELLVLTFCIFSYWGTDWFHYFDIFQSIKGSPFFETHMEPFYSWLIYNLSPNYVVFRFIVWGVALWFFINSLKILYIDISTALLFFVAGFLIWFSYSRASLAMGVMFWGAAMILHDGKRNKVLSFMLGFTGLLLSIYLHKSAVMGVMIIALVLLLNLIQSKSYKLLILLIPIFLLGLRMLLNNMSDFVSDDEYIDFVANTASRNIENESTTMGIGSLLQFMLEKLPYFMTAICGILIQIRHRNLPKSILGFSNIQILFVIISTLFMFLDEFNTRTLSVRLFRFGLIPSTIILAYCWQNQFNVKLVKVTFGICFVSTTYQLLYSLYVIL